MEGYCGEGGEGEGGENGGPVKERKRKTGQGDHGILFLLVLFCGVRVRLESVFFTVL